MKKLLYACSAFIILHLTINLGAASAQTVQIYRGASAVGAPYSTVAAAIIAASDGDSLKLSAHTFNEHDLDINKSLVFAGTITTTDTSKVDAKGLGRCFKITKRGTNITMRDFIVTGGNTTDNGAGIYFDNIPFSTTYTTLALAGKMIVRGNTSAATGGGIGQLLSANYLKLTVKDKAQVSYNTANKAGGITLGDNCILALEGDAYIHHNTAVSGGGIVAGEIMINGGASEGGVRIMYNSVTNSGGGFGTTILILNSTLNVSYNHADSMGGGVGGLMYLNGTGQLLVNNNTAYYGGGAGGEFGYFNGDSATVIMSNNRAKFGGGLCSINFANAYCKNLQLINNTADSAGGGAYFSNTLSASMLKGALISANLERNKAPRYPGIYITGYREIQLKKCRIFNPLPSGKQSIEVYAANNVTVASDSCWFGKSDTTGLLVCDASSFISVARYVKCTWVLNNGVPVSWMPFPLTAKFKLSTGAAMLPGSLKMLEGRYSGTYGTFVPALAAMKNSNEIESIFKATATGTSNIMGIVDADTFKTAQAVTGIKELGFEEVKIFPNPAKDFISINGVAMRSQIRLYNLLGQLIKNEEATTRNVVLDVKDLPAGTYIIKIRTEEGREGSVNIILNAEF